MRILLVEDERRVASGVRRGLEAEGFDVDIETDGASGLARAGQVSYDIVILDIMLPGLNGFQVCARLRERGDWTPILMLTAKTGEYDEAEALDTGADDYLTKPFSFVVLLARLHALLRRPRRDAAEPLVVGDLRLDPSRHRCWLGTTEISLTAREMEVLSHLMQRAGLVVAKSEILADIWGPEFEGDPNIVEVYIRHLRRKLEEPSDNGIITTIRGVGYRLDARGAP